MLTKSTFWNNCHGFTFGRDYEELEVKTMEKVMQLWDKHAMIAVCFMGDEVVHTAKIIDGCCHQTLSDRPRFITSINFLKSKYIEVQTLSSVFDGEVKKSATNTLFDFEDF